MDGLTNIPWWGIFMLGFAAIAAIGMILFIWVLETQTSDGETDPYQSR